jgi:hypothetical protein
MRSFIISTHPTFVIVVKVEGMRWGGVNNMDENRKMLTKFLF